MYYIYIYVYIPDPMINSIIHYVMYTLMFNGLHNSDIK